MQVALEKFGGATLLSQQMLVLLHAHLLYVRQKILMHAFSQVLVHLRCLQVMSRRL